MNYEYKCPFCGTVNLKNGMYARIVCSNCKAEFIPILTPQSTIEFQIPNWTSTYKPEEYTFTVMS